MAAAAPGQVLRDAQEARSRTSSSSRARSSSRIAKEIGLDVDKFTKDLDAHTYAAADPEGVEGGRRTSAPPARRRSFINGRYLSGAKPVRQSSRTMIDEELRLGEGRQPAGVQDRARTSARRSAKRVSGRRARSEQGVRRSPPATRSSRGPANGQGDDPPLLTTISDRSACACRPTLEQDPGRLSRATSAWSTRCTRSRCTRTRCLRPRPRWRPTRRASSRQMHEKLFANSAASVAGQVPCSSRTEIGLDVKKFTSDIDAQRLQRHRSTREARGGDERSARPGNAGDRFVSGDAPLRRAAVRRLQEEIIDEELHPCE